MQVLKSFVPLREYCRQNEWPRLTQWHHWIYSRSPVAEQCIKKIGGRYLVDVNAFQNYVTNATLGASHPYQTTNKK